MRITLSSDSRFLEVDFERPQRCLSWAIVGGGFAVHHRVVWHFVRREELGVDVDARELLRERLQAAGYEAALGMLTARYLAPYAEGCASFGDVTARVVCTLGLGNALRVGDPPYERPARVGTINLLCHVSVPLSEAALLEALSLAAEARTAALLEARYPSIVSELPATGTGTDCTVIACPSQGEPRAYAGKHTEVGAAIGRSVLEATRRATQGWLAEQLDTRVG